jgi:hypothetical protein
VSDYLLYVNDDRTAMVRIWPGGPAEFATREDAGDIWGPPVTLHADRYNATARQHLEILAELMTTPGRDA